MKNTFLTIVMAIAGYCSYAQYLPLTAGNGNPLTGDLYIDGTTGSRLIFSYSGVGNSKVLLGSNYSIFGAGSKDDLTTYVRDNNPYSVWTNSLQRLIVNGDGNVGIGTTTPARKLDILSGTGVTPLAAVGPGGSVLIDNVGSGQSFYQANSFHQFQGSGGTPILTMFNGGNIGIGTASPVSIVDMEKNQNSNTIAYLRNTDSGSSATSQYIATDGNGNLQMGQTGTGFSSSGLLFPNSSFILSNQKANGLKIFTADATNLTLGTNNSAAFTILPGGNIGIGTVTPARKLDILSGTGVTPLAVIGPNGGILIDNVGSGQSYYQANSFHQFQGASGNPIVTMYNGGNVAIGTTDPKGYKLAVAGDAIAESMTVDLQANWPDYVFEKSYSLPPLSEVKTYIDQNQHLPGVPTADQVSKSGINLGEMNALLMKKVEELTLYLIEKDKQINEMNDKQQEINKQLLEQIKVLQNQLKQKL